MCENVASRSFVEPPMDNATSSPRVNQSFVSQNLSAFEKDGSISSSASEVSSHLPRGLEEMVRSTMLPKILKTGSIRATTTSTDTNVTLKHITAKHGVPSLSAKQLPKPKASGGDSARQCKKSTSQVPASGGQLDVRSHQKHVSRGILGKSTGLSSGTPKVVLDSSDEQSEPSKCEASRSGGEDTTRR